MTLFNWYRLNYFLLYLNLSYLGLKPPRESHLKVNCNVKILVYLIILFALSSQIYFHFLHNSPVQIPN